MIITIGREHGSNSFGKETAVVAHVVTYNHANLVAVGKSLFKIVAESLCRSAYSVFVHAVATHTHDTAETACTKFKVFVKRLDKFGLIFVFKHLSHFGFSCIIIAIAKPHIGFSDNRFH